MKRDVNLRLVSRLVFLTIFAMIIIYAFEGLSARAEAASAEAAGRVAAVIRKAVGQCYALEGAYPPNIGYLARYGVVIDEERFFYYYDQNGVGNYMPEIFVAPR